MPLTGQAKTDYQCEYMRQRRSNQRSNAEVRSNIKKRIESVRPSNGTEQDDVRVASERLTAALVGPAVVDVEQEQEAMAEQYREPEPQSYNPMMVGYVPPTD